MKKLLFSLIAALACVSAFGAANDMILQQRNATDTSTLTRITTIPAPGVDGLFFFSGTTVQPAFVTIGSGLQVSGGALAATAAAQVNSDWAAVSGVTQILNKPSLATVATTGSYNDLTNKPAAVSQASAARSLNSAFQISTTRNALVFYSVQCTITASIAGGQNCDVILEIASDSGFTTNVQTLSIAGTGQTYTLAIALQGVQPQTGVVSGMVPANYYTRLRTVQNTGAPTFSYRAGQEVLL